MKIAVFSSKRYNRIFLSQINEAKHEIMFFEEALKAQTAKLAQGFDAVCIFVNDTVCAETIACLKSEKVGCIALRCAGFNNVDLKAAEAANISVFRVPRYSPHAVAEHTAAILLAVNRKIHRAHSRVREGNFSIDGLLGFDLHGKTIGLIGSGAIGTAMARIALGFGMRVLMHDPYPSAECQSLDVNWGGIPDLILQADIISLHCPLLPSTHHIIDDSLIEQMKTGVIIINTSRGASIDTKALIRGLKARKIGAVGLDVYEEEENLFFEDRSDQIIDDEVFSRLLTFPNVLITSHQAFFTEEALERIASVTLANLEAWKNGDPLENAVNSI